MDYLTGNRVTSLAEHVVSRITLKHAALNAAVNDDPADPMEVSRLIAEIWQLAADYDSAVMVEDTLGRIRHAARGGRPTRAA